MSEQHPDPYADIQSFIKVKEAEYRQPVELGGGWSWSMLKHIEDTFLYLHSRIRSKTDWTPIKNIIRPITNLQHRVEDLEVKDVQLYVDNPDLYHLSFLVKRYHDDVFVQEHDLDTYLDELNVSRIDYGLGVSMKMGKPCPEVVPLQSIAFCDQTDITSGPLGLRYFFSPDQLQEMADRGWGNPDYGATGTIAEVIQLAGERKREDQNNTDNETPGKYIEVVLVLGVLPKKFLDPTDTSGLFVRQLRAETPYRRKDDADERPITLFAMEDKENRLKAIKRDPVYGRAVGFGGAEELFEPQAWVNYDQIRKQDMLDAASKTIMITSDSELASRHPRGLKDLENMEFIEEAVSGNTRMLDTFPRNYQLFDKSSAEWELHAQQMGAANDAIMGASPASGTPFKLQELVTMESHGLHEYRRGQFAKHVEEIYRDWIIPHIIKEITKGAKFLSDLSLEDLQYVTECIVTAKANEHVKEMVLAGETPTQEEVDIFKELVRSEIKKRGSKQFIEILKGEFKDAPLAVKVSVVGKSKDLSRMVDKLVNIFRFVFSNPVGFAQVMQVPGMAKSFNQILEASGLSPADFSGIDKIIQPEAAPEAPGAMQELPPGPEPMEEPVAA